MIVYHGLEDKKLKAKPRCIALGIFDGVHRGHQKILRKVVDQGRRCRTSSMVVTFEPHPNRVLNPRESHPILMSLPHRIRLFKQMRIREVLVIRFNQRFSKVPHETFLNRILVRHLGMRSLCVGDDFRFGCKGRGNVVYLKQKSRELGFRFSAIPAIRFQREVISSTSIRRLIEQGKLRRAAKMLGRPVSVYGTVVHGQGRGRSLGFPTANLNPHHETLPPSGVYVAWGMVNQSPLKAVIHIGPRPTFRETGKTLEVHFLNFHQNLYGRELELIFLKRLRAIRKFKSPRELASAIKKDIYKCRLTRYNYPKSNIN